MTLENLEKEIMAEANRKARAILDGAASERRQIINEAGKEAKEMCNAMEAEAKSRWEQEELEELTKAKMRAKGEISLEKKLLVEKVYKEFEERLKGKSSNEMLKKLFERGKRELENAGTVYVAGKDLQPARKLFRGIEVKEKEIGGGIILESRDSLQSADLSLSTLSEAARKRTIRKASSMLFGSG